mgnify:CR=1 FL=1
MQISSCLWGFLLRVLIKVLILFLLFFFLFIYLLTHASMYMFFLNWACFAKTRTAHVFTKNNHLLPHWHAIRTHISVYIYSYTPMWSDTIRSFIPSRNDRERRLSFTVFVYRSSMVLRWVWVCFICISDGPMAVLPLSSLHSFCWVSARHVHLFCHKQMAIRPR